MNTELIQRMQSGIDALAQTSPGIIDMEFWYARDLQEPLGYARWENFLTAIQRAIQSCKTTGYKATDHFRDVTKMISIGKKHVQNNTSVRKMLDNRGIKPEEKKLERNSGRLPEQDPNI